MAQWVVSSPSRQDEALLHSGVLAHTCGSSAALEAEAGESEAQGRPLLPPFLGTLPSGFHLPFSAFSVPSAPSYDEPSLSVAGCGKMVMVEVALSKQRMAFPCWAEPLHLASRLDTHADMPAKK